MEGIFKNYKDKEVLKGIDVTLGNGVYGLLGPNGSGKTMSEASAPNTIPIK